MAHLESKTSDKATDSGAGDKDEWATLNERIDARGAELRAINERQQAQRKIVAELQAKKNEQRSSLGGLFERRDELNKGVREAKAEISQLKQAHYKCVPRLVPACLLCGLAVTCIPLWWPCCQRP